ncbi:lamin tail domain-containing protein [Thermococcus sp.]|uniref:lamin tail domain-containing protein n=1 Tax=Thermococcus sp. TaxID=35749 RepID=UPI00261CFDFA|nr:lamin tail domain-containing protein [Thermococcus sp.]
MALLRKPLVLTLILAVFAAACLSPGPSPSSQSGPSRGVEVLVTRVVDGDTAYVRFPNGSVDKVRFLGVDAPETELARNRPYEYGSITDLVCLTRWGEKAKEFTKASLQGRRVFLVFDRLSPRRGYFGRLLAYVYLPNGTDFTAELVERGYARVYTEGEFTKKGLYLRYQGKAESRKLGVWSCEAGERSPSVVIVSVVYDAPGDDADNLNGEYVLLKNVGESAVNLAGWELRDADGNSFRFPEVYLSPGAELRIHSGRGISGPSDLYWNSTVPVWDNDGDTAYLYNSEGHLVDVYRW